MIIRDSFMRDIAKIIAWYPLRWFVTAMPWSVAYFIGELVGSIDCFLARGRKATIVRNLLSVFAPEMTGKTAGEVCKRIIQRHYMEHMEFYKFATLNRDNLHRHISFEGIDILEEALKQGKGAILVHMHFGCKQFPLVALGLSGYPVCQLGYRDQDADDYSFIHKNVHLRIRMRIESKFNAKLIHIGDSLRPVYEALNENEILMITGDGVGGVRGAGSNYIPVQFLGKTMLCPPGPARIARKTGAALIPFFCVQGEGRTYKAVFESPVEIEDTNNRDEDIRVVTKRFVSVFEKYVREYPDHWMFWEEFQKDCLLV